MRWSISGWDALAPGSEGSRSRDRYAHLGDIFAALDAEKFQQCFVNWVVASTNCLRSGPVSDVCEQVTGTFERWGACHGIIAWPQNSFGPPPPGALDRSEQKVNIYSRIGVSEYRTRQFDDRLFQSSCHLPAAGQKATGQKATGHEAAAPPLRDSDDQRALARWRFAIQTVGRAGRDERRRATNDVVFLPNEANGRFVNDFNGAVRSRTLFTKALPSASCFTERSQSRILQ